MAIKPATIFTFATDAVFGSGPASGFATKIVPGSIAQGFIPGTGINAEWVNYLFNVTGQWLTDWLNLGSSLPGLDAHLIETDALGQASIAGLALGGTAAAYFALDVQENAGASSAAILAQNNSGGFAINCSSNNGSTPTFRATQQGSGVCGDFNNFGTGGGITADAAAGGSGTGVAGNGGGLGGIGGIFTGGAGLVGGHGVIGIGAGLLGSGGIFTAAAASGGAAAEFFQSGAGNPVRGCIHIDPGGNPTAPIDGDVWKRAGFAGFGRGELRWWDDDGAPGGGAPGEQTAWSTAAGLGFQSFASLDATNEAAGNFVVKVAGTLGLNASPGDPPGQWVVEYSCTVSLGAGSALTARAIVEFLDASGVVGTVQMDFSALGQDKTASFLHVVTLGAGTDPLSIRFRSGANPLDNVNCSNARIIARGAYE